MEHNLTPLCDIDPMLDDIKVVARCISKWKPHTFGKPSDVWSLDFVLQDAQVCTILIRLYIISLWICFVYTLLMFMFFIVNFCLKAFVYFYCYKVNVF